MLSAIFYLALTAWAAWLIRRYKTTGEKKHLQSAGTLLFVITFAASFNFGVDAVLFPGRGSAPYITLLAGSLAGGLLLAAGYTGWSKIYAAAQAAVFAIFTLFVIGCLGYFEKVIVIAHAQGVSDRLVPGTASKQLRTMTPDQKQAAAQKIAQALPGTADEYVRVGLFYKLGYIPEHAGPALPFVIQRIPEAPEREFGQILVLLQAMGPAAAEAAPALRARAEGGDGGRYYSIYTIRGVLDAIAPQPASGPRTI